MTNKNFWLGWIFHFAPVCLNPRNLNMQVPFKVISLSHQNAPIEIRELIYLPEAVCKALLLRLKEVFKISETLIFSTCNRTEIYYISEHDYTNEIITLLGLEKGIHPIHEYKDFFRFISKESLAIQYLFEVSIGLHSKVLGDIQIAHQIKEAYRCSVEVGLAGPYIHRLMHTIFHTNKRVYNTTAFREGAASVSYASAELAASLFRDVPSSKVLVLGMGEMGKDVALSLNRSIFPEIHLMNRSYEKALNLANKMNALALTIDELPEKIGDYDLIISAISVDKPFITKDLLEGNGSSRLSIIDLGVPRNVSSEVQELSYVSLYNIDDITAQTSKVFANRKAAIPVVKTIIQEEMYNFMDWRKQLLISPIIQHIKNSLEDIRQNELARYLKHATQEQTNLLDQVTQSMVSKILKMPVLHLKEICKRDNPDELINAVYQLFTPNASIRKLK